MGCYYSRPPENCRYVPVESGARLDHWFGPGSSGPLEQYNQVLQRCVADDSGSGGGGGGGGFGAHSSGGGGGGGQLRPSAEEVVRMLEDIHEGEGQAEHLRLMVARARAIECTSSFRLAVEEPLTARAPPAAAASIHGGVPPLRRQPSEQEQQQQQQQEQQQLPPPATATAQAQAHATRVARADGLGQKGNATTTAAAGKPKVDGGGSGSGSGGGGLVPADAANLFTFRSVRATRVASWNDAQFDLARRRHDETASGGDGESSTTTTAGGAGSGSSLRGSPRGGRRGGGVSSSSSSAHSNSQNDQRYDEADEYEVITKRSF
jgi:hypothetical protein